MKMVFLVLVMLSLVAVYTGTARAYDPYYDSYNVSVQYLPPYDPYYELHQIHYQLYLKPYYPHYYQYYPVSPVQVFIIERQPREVRAGQPARRR